MVNVLFQTSEDDVTSEDVGNQSGANTSPKRTPKTPIYRNQQVNIVVLTA